MQDSVSKAIVTPSSGEPWGRSAGGSWFGDEIFRRRDDAIAMARPGGHEENDRSDDLTYADGFGYATPAESGAVPPLAKTGGTASFLARRLDIAAARFLV